MNNLEIAKQELSKVGGALAKEMKIDSTKAAKIKSLLLTLKKVNTEIESLINGEDEFSFDTFEESATSQKSKLQESNDQDYGVDLGDFNNFINKEDPNAFDWKKTFREANGGTGGGVDVNMDTISNSEFDPNTLGRMIDNT